jgi:DNA-binding NtrC family response regulator
MIPDFKPDGDSGRTRILFVDDDAALLEITVLLLNRQGYLVTPFIDSKEAISNFRESPDAFDVVLTDYCMPDIDGIKLTRMVKELVYDIPVILHTGKIDLVDEKEAARAGITQIITKPYKISELDEIIRKFI